MNWSWWEQWDTWICLAGKVAVQRGMPLIKVSDTFTSSNWEKIHCMLVAYLSYMRVSQGCSVVEYEEMSLVQPSGLRVGQVQKSTFYLMQTVYLSVYSKILYGYRSQVSLTWTLWFCSVEGGVQYAAYWCGSSRGGNGCFNLQPPSGTSGT